MFNFKKKPKSINNIYRGDIVRVIDLDNVYQNYSQMAKKMPRKDQLRWVYREMPNQDHKFVVLDIFNHMIENRFDNGTVAIAIQDIMTSQVYLVNEFAIEFHSPNPDPSKHVVRQFYHAKVDGIDPIYVRRNR